MGPPSSSFLVPGTLRVPSAFVRTIGHSPVGEGLFQAVVPDFSHIPRGGLAKDQPSALVMQDTTRADEDVASHFSAGLGALSTLVFMLVF